MHGALLLIHILAATVWTGGHLVLALSVLPRAFRSGSTDQIEWFEAGYERVGLPALFLQVLTGIGLANGMAPSMASWFDPSDPVGRFIGAKLLLLVATLVLAAHARLRVLPGLTRQRLPALAWHIIPVTVLSVLFVVVGVAFRTGWFY